MSLINHLSAVLLASLCCNAANAKLDPSKYTVTFKYNEVSWCLGGIISDKYVISSADCFAGRDGSIFKFSSIKAVVGSVETEVQSVILPEFQENEERAIHDFAIVKLKESLNLEENGLIALKLSNQDPPINSTGFESQDDKEVKIVDPENCPNNEEMSFYADSQFCAEVPNPADSCWDQPGSPLLDQEDKLIGVYLDCYEDTPRGVFAKVSFFADLISDAVAGKPGL